MADRTEQVGLRKENFQRAIEGLTSQMYILKTLVGTTTTDAWKDTYWTEDPTVLTSMSPNIVIAATAMIV